MTRQQRIIGGAVAVISIFLGNGATLLTTPAAAAATDPTPTSTPTTTQRDRDTDIGITDHEIVLAVIADDPDTFQGMAAWQTAVNRRGGLAGRKIHLDMLGTGGTATGYETAVVTACEHDFAIVGSLSQFDMSAEAAGCDAIPDLAVEPVDGDRAAASNTFAAFPRQTGIEAVGPFTWLRDNITDCCAQFGLEPDTEPGRAPTIDAIDAAVAAGFTTAGTTAVSLGDGATRYTEIVDELEAATANFATSGLGRYSTVLLRQAASGRAPDVLVWYCDARCYDVAFLADGGDAVEGQYVAIETVPFGDRSQIGALRTYVRYTAKAGDDTTYAGLRAFATGMLFEDAAKQMIDDNGEDGLTRAHLLDALAGIHDFDAGGIIGPTDVSAATPTGCYVLLHVVNRRFKRLNPVDKGSLDCGSENLVELG